MLEDLDRRSFLQLGVGTLATVANFRLGEPASMAASVPSHFPLQDPVLVREMVLVAHGNVARVKELLSRQPALARAAIDWGYGDWESALGAAAHVGNREIGELLIANGARPSLFSAAMFGHVDVVRSFVAAAPGIQSTLGPHSITLLAHAKAGGDKAKAVVEFLQEIGGADSLPPIVPLDDASRGRYLGTYAFGANPNERLIVALNRELMTIQRPGGPYRGMRHLGNHEFHPVGAEAVRIRFDLADGAASADAVSVFDPGLLVRATRAS